MTNRRFRRVRDIQDASSSATLLWIVLLIGLCLVPSVPADALTFEFTDTGGAAAGSLAGNAFREAAALWEAVLFDPITVRLDIGFRPLDPGVLGSTQTHSAVVRYQDARDALVADARGLSDSVAVAHLEAGNSLTFLTQDQFGTSLLDNDGSANNTFLSVPTANLKALRLSTDASGNPVDDGTSADAKIEFSSLLGFDFDRSDGIDPAQFDFVGVAAHEIGHALGFVSGVDVIDRVSEPNGPSDPTGGDPNTPAGGFDLDTFAVFSVLDLYRFSEDSPPLDLRYGGAPFLSIDGGVTRGLRFATGEFNGDGDQASHWIDDQNLGPIMLGPSASQGELLFIIPLDVVAFDVIGYNRFVPQAPTLLLVGLGLLVLVGLARRGR